MTSGVKLKDRDTHVFIDASNIRSACLKSCNFNIDFTKLYTYLNNKYPNLKEVGYYEGIARNDGKKQLIFDQLDRTGYSVRALRRRTYTNPAVMKNFKCRHCGERNRIEVLHQEIVMKSNVDVFLTAEMLKVAYESTTPTHIVIFTCDGDYAEAIRVAVRNENVVVTVVGTPFIQELEKNALSVRLRELRRELPEQYHLNNIEDIKDSVRVDEETGAVNIGEEVTPQ
ncbi:NYN domain-containing protein [Candidatus Saccharibacteria bacterium]|nr:NYN domain-containing protein [Candidatus Saccharibacteria bacterium]